MINTTKSVVKRLNFIMQLSVLSYLIYFQWKCKWNLPWRSQSTADPSLFLWEEQVPLAQDSDERQTNHVKRKALLWTRKDPKVPMTLLDPSLLEPPDVSTFHAGHPLRTKTWRIRFKSPSKLPLPSTADAEFDPSGYVRLSWCQHPEDPGEMPSAVVGRWEFCRTTYRLEWKITIGGEDYEFHTDWIHNAYGDYPKLTRGVVLRAKRHRFKPVVATFDGHGEAR